MSITQVSPAGLWEVADTPPAPKAVATGKEAIVWSGWG